MPSLDAVMLRDRLRVSLTGALPRDICRPPPPTIAPGAVGTERTFGVFRFAVDVVEDVADPLTQRLWINAGSYVVGDLLRSAAVGLVDRGSHRGRDLVGVHVDLPGDVTGGSADGLDQCRPDRRKPSLSASRMETSETSGRSRPSRRRLMPTSTS